MRCSECLGIGILHNILGKTIKCPICNGEGEINEPIKAEKPKQKEEKKNSTN